MVKIDLNMNLDVSKKFIALCSVILLLMGLFAVSYAGNGQFNLPLEWVINSNGQSVDSDNNGVIDNSDKLTGLTAADLSAVGTGTEVLTHYVAIGAKSCALGYNKAYDGIVAAQYGTSPNPDSIAYIGTEGYGGYKSYCVGSESSTDSSNTMYGGHSYYSFWSFKGNEYTGPNRVACVVCIRG